MEVEITGGIAQATSAWSKEWSPARAFVMGDSNGWHNAKKSFGMFPEMIWYSFPKNKAFVPGRISFRPRFNKKFLNQGDRDVDL